MYFTLPDMSVSLWVIFIGTRQGQGVRRSDCQFSASLLCSPPFILVLQFMPCSCTNAPHFRSTASLILSCLWGAPHPAVPIPLSPGLPIQLCPSSSSLASCTSCCFSPGLLATFCSGPSVWTNSLLFHPSISDLHKNEIS